MIYESSYESGRMPFVPVIKRGYWTMKNDFIYASLGLSYRMDIFLLFVQWSDKVSITSLIPAFTISLALYTIPLLMVQSFMGQFSSSGFISALRISPIFKGIGYVSLVLNIMVLIFCSLYAMISLVYLVASFNPILPWHCKGIYNWVDFCNQKIEINETDEYFDFSAYFQIPSTLYFDTIFHSFDIFGITIFISWEMVISAICIWIIIILIIHKITDISKIGQLIKRSVQIILFLLIILIMRLSFLPRSNEILSDIFMPNLKDFFDGIKSIPNFGISAFGPGWGLILTLASFNKFNTNIRHTSWLIGIGHTLMIILYITLELLIKGFISLLSHEMYHRELKPYITLYLTGGSVFASMAWPNFWSIIFYFMLFLAGLTSMIIQMIIISYSIFDEFISLRRYKTQVNLSLIGLMTITSLYFTSKHGYENFTFLRFDTLITQSLIDLLVILLVLWVYGRQRFQRDLEFMISEHFATWKIFVLRFLAPIVLIIALCEGLLASLFHILFGKFSITIFNLIVRPLPWLCVPGYAIYCLLKSRGPLKMRFLKCSRPTDWYPVELEDRNNYEDIVNNANMTHPLNILDDKENT